MAWKVNILIYLGFVCLFDDDEGGTVAQWLVLWSRIFRVKGLNLASGLCAWRVHVLLVCPGVPPVTSLSSHSPKIVIQWLGFGHWLETEPS